MTIRRVVQADLAAVNALAEEVATAPRWPLAEYERLFHEGAVICIAEQEGHLAGFLVATCHDVGEVESIVVAPGYRRQGIARALWFEALPQMPDEVLLEVRAGNEPALSLYRSLGFVQVGQRRGYYSQPLEDAMVLQWSRGMQDGRPG